MPALSTVVSLGLLSTICTHPSAKALISKPFTHFYLFQSKSHQKSVQRRITKTNGFYVCPARPKDQDINAYITTQLKLILFVC